MNTGMGPDGMWTLTSGIPAGPVTWRFSWILGSKEIGYRLFERYYQALYEYRYGELKKGKEELLAVQKVARFLDAKLVLEKSEEALK